MARNDAQKDFFEIGNFCGYYVSGEMGPIPTIAEPALDNLFGNYTIAYDNSSYGQTVPIGAAKELVLKHSLRRLTFDNNERSLNRDKISSSIPPLRDEETGESLFERLVKLAVKRNRWLVKRSYGNLFEHYLADERVIDAEGSEDPTAGELPPPMRNGSGATSTSESSSTSPSAKIPTPMTTTSTDDSSTEESPESNDEMTSSQRSSDSERSTLQAVSQS